MGLALEAWRLLKAYNGHEVLADCSLTGDPGKTYTLQGPNGSGKSTLLRILALLEKPDRGEVRYRHNGQILKNDLELRRKITLLLPGIGVFNTTVFANVAYGLRLRGLVRDEIEARVKEGLQRVGLAEKSWQPAWGLSSGETKRLGLARALVLEPDVLFLDEPTASIDPVNTEIIEEIILQLKNRGETTIILVTHDPGQAARLGDHLLFMDRGRIFGGGGQGPVDPAPSTKPQTPTP